MSGWICDGCGKPVGLQEDGKWIIPHLLKGKMYCEVCWNDITEQD